MNLGNNEIKRQLEELGFVTKILNNFVCFDYTIPHGKFINQQVEIALEANQFPMIPPSGIYVKPHIMPITGGGGTHPNGGIHARKTPTSEFQYWSRPFNNWNKSKKTMKEYIAFIRRLMDFK